MDIASILATKGGPLTGDLVGIVTERHIVREVAKNQRVLTQTVGEIMTRDVVTGAPHDDLQSVSIAMAGKRIRHLPVLDNGRLVGIISLGDVVRAQRDTYRGAVDILETRVLGEAP